jgi:hypothetical protein
MRLIRVASVLGFLSAVGLTACGSVGPPASGPDNSANLSQSEPNLSENKASLNAEAGYCCVCSLDGSICNTGRCCNDGPWQGADQGCPAWCEYAGGDLGYNGGKVILCGNANLLPNCVFPET